VSERLDGRGAAQNRIEEAAEVSAHATPIGRVLDLLELGAEIAGDGFRRRACMPDRE
jgi:hypothetical protein